MSRPKGAINKPKSGITDTTESDAPKKTRGRQKGEKVETTSAILNINKNFRVKMTDRNFTLQEKGKEDDDLPDDDLDAKDAGWKFVGHFSPSAEGLMDIAKRIKSKLILKKAAEKTIVNWEETIKILQDSNQEVAKMFAPLGIKITSNDKTEEIVKKYKKNTDDMGEDE